MLDFNQIKISDRKNGSHGSYAYCLQCSWEGEVDTLNSQRAWRGAYSQYKHLTLKENPYKKPLKKCILCEKRVDDKSVWLWFQFTSPFTGCIYGRHITGLCGKKTERNSRGDEESSIIMIYAITYKDPEYLKDSKVSNI
jgi:small subunit ribosomal protein S18